MRGAAERRLAGAGLATLLTLAGCGHELVRVSVEPGASDLELDPPDVRPRCAVERSDSVNPRTGERHWYADEGLSQTLARRLRGTVAEGAPPDDAHAAASVRATVLGRPSLPALGDQVIKGLSIFLFPIGVPLALVHLEHEPELTIEAALEVGVVGEPPAWRDVVVARGVVSARPWSATDDGYRVYADARDRLVELALDVLAARFAADAAARTRLVADLDPGPRPLEALLVTRETHPPRAHWRTQQLVGWKNERLDGHLAEIATPALRALVTRLETTAAELAREAELAKDAATRATAAPEDGAEERSAGALERELSLAYLERVEVLRPILAQVKEELDARSR